MRKVLNMVFVAIVCLITLSTTNVKADSTTPPPFLGGKYTRGIGRVSYYVDYPSGTGFYEYLIIAAQNGWEYTGWDNPIYMVAAAENSGTMLDIYTKHNNFWPGNPGTYGETRYFNDYGVRINPRINYIYTEIYINDDENHYRDADQVKGC